jgi:hypothetical protein
VQRQHIPPETILSTNILGAIKDDEQNLLNINLQIKATITELLNCWSVKSDKKFRIWILQANGCREGNQMENRTSTPRRRS